MFNMFTRSGARMGQKFRSAGTRGSAFRQQQQQQFRQSRRFLSSTPLHQRHPQPYSWGKILATGAAAVIGYCGYDRFAGERVIAFEKKRIKQRERQEELRDIRSRPTDTNIVVEKLLEENPEPVDWDVALDSLKEAPESAPIHLQISSSKASSLFEGRAGVIALEIDSDWTKENMFQKFLELVEYPLEEHPTEDVQERFYAILQRLAKKARAPSVLLVKKTNNVEVLKQLQLAVREPALGGAYGVYLINVQ